MPEKGLFTTNRWGQYVFQSYEDSLDEASDNCPYPIWDDDIPSGVRHLPSSSVLTTPKRPSIITTPLNLALVALLEMGEQRYILVRPSFAKGGFGHCSVWKSLNDGNLYIRKLQVTAGGKPKDITHHVSAANVPALVAYVDHGRNLHLGRVGEKRAVVLNDANERSLQSLWSLH